MITIDKSFTKNKVELLQNIIGQNFRLYQSDPFVYNNLVYAIVGIQVDNRWLSITNEIQVMNYYGSNEDICVLDINEVSENEIHSYLENGKQIQVQFNKKVKDIKILNETQTLSQSEIPLYKYIFVRGVSFIFDDDSEVAFEKVDPFSEQIAITRGEHLAESFPERISPEDFRDTGILTVTREIQKISNE